MANRVHQLVPSAFSKRWLWEVIGDCKMCQVEAKAFVKHSIYSEDVGGGE